MMNEQATKGKVTAIVVLSLLLLVVAVSEALAYNDTDMQQLHDELANLTAAQQQAIIAQLLQMNNSINGMNVTHTVQITQAQLDNITAAARAAINGSVSSICNPYFNPNGSLADPLQVRLAAAIDNEMDTKFIDQRQWIAETYIKKQDEYNGLNDQLHACTNDMKVLQNTYETAKITANATYNLAVADREHAEENAQNWMYITLVLAALFIITQFDWVKKLIHKET